MSNYEYVLLRTGLKYTQVQFCLFADVTPLSLARIRESRALKPGAESFSFCPALTSFSRDKQKAGEFTEKSSCCNPP